MVAQSSKPLNSENASPFGTRTVYLSCAEGARAPEGAEAARSPETASSAPMAATAAAMLIAAVLTRRRLWLIG